MANTLKIKRGAAASIPTGQLAEPLFTSDTYDLYIGTGASNQRFQKYIASGTSSQFLKGDGSLDSTSYQTALTFSSPLVNTSGTISIPAATGSVNGYLTSTDWTTFNSKEPAITAGTTLQYYRGDKTFQTLDTAAVPENGAIYFTEPRVRATVLTGLNLSGGGTIAATDSVLTAFGKVQNQISALVGGATYQGTWNASTNTPTLTSGTGTKGYYYVVSVAGSTNLDGITDWKIGDWAIFNGTTWDKVDNTDAVSSVNGFTGAVNLALDNISDVSAASPTNAQLLRFNGTSSLWENWTPTFEPALTKGNLTEATSSVLTITGGTGAVIGSGTSIEVKQASGSVSGYLSSTDWTTFNGKQAQLNGTGFVKASGTTISYDNTSYLPLGGGTLTGALSGTSISLSSSITASALYVSGMTAGNGAIYHTGSRLTFANYNASGTLHFEVNGGAGAMTINSDKTIKIEGYTTNGFVKTSASDGTLIIDTNTYLTTSSAASTYLPLTGGTLTGALSGTSATFSGDVAGGRIFASQNNALIQAYDSRTSGGSAIIRAYSGTNYADFYMSNANGSTLKIGINGSDIFSITNTGAATFSSSVTANTYIELIGDLRFNSTSADRSIYFRGSSGTPDTNWKMGNYLTPTGATVVTAAATVIDVFGGASTYGFMIRNTSNAPLLQIAGNTGAATFSSSVTATNGIFTVDDSGTNTIVDVLTLTHTTSGTAASGLGAGILFRSERPSGGITLSRAAIYGVAGTDANDDGDMTFYTLTDTGVSGFSEKMRITSGGNVGIGTNSPQSFANTLTLHMNGGSSGSFFTMAGSGTRYLTILAQSGEGKIETNTAIPLIFATQETERMRITSGGVLEAYYNALFSKTNATSYITINSSNSSYQSTIYFAEGSSNKWEITKAVTTPHLDFYSYTSASTVMRLTSTGNTELAGSIKTGAPSGGTAKPWKLGARLSGTVSTSTTNYLEVEIDGTLYYLAFAVPL